LNNVIGQARSDRSIQNSYFYSPYGISSASGADDGNRIQYTGRENDDIGLYYYRARYYDPALKRFITEDPIGLAGGGNKYEYSQGNPVSLRDPWGLWAGIDDAIFAGGGALIGLAGQGVSDLLSGNLSGWEDYVGSAAGGAAFGETLLYAGPVAAGLVGGAVTNATKQGLKNLTGKQCGFNWTSFGFDTAVGGATGFIPGRPRIPGINAGRNSMNAIYGQMATKFGNGTISNVTAGTAGKMFVGRAYDTAVPYGVAGGATAGVFGGPLVPGYSDPCTCQ
jgi:RHS repeat-associated protein